MKRVLFEIPEIYEHLTAHFMEIPIDLRENLSQLLLKKSNLKSQSLEETEVLLGVTLPESLRSMILEYDFGDLTLGGVWFGRKETYLEYLVKYNTYREGFLNWWDDTDRPTNLLVVADSDGYVILVNTGTGQIVAFDRNESYDKIQVVASNFKLFFQGVATMDIRYQNSEDKELMYDIPLAVGSSNENEFWQQMIIENE